MLACGYNLSLLHAEYSDDNDDVLQPACKHQKLANEIALRASLTFGLYPEFLGKKGPVESHSPDLYDALDYFKLLCPDALASLIVTETNRYA